MANWKHWLHGLAAATIHGFASGVALIVVDPADFNFGEGLTKLLTVSGMMALLGAASYLKQSPLPPEPPETPHA